MQFTAQQRANIELELIVQRNGHRVQTHPSQIDMGSVSVSVEEPEHFIIEEAVDIALVCKKSDRQLIPELSAKVAHVCGDVITLDFVGHDLEALEQVFMACRNNAQPKTGLRLGRTPVAVGIAMTVLFLLGFGFVQWGDVESEADTPVSDNKAVVIPPVADATSNAVADEVGRLSTDSVLVAPPLPSERVEVVVESMPVRALLVSALNREGNVLRRNWALVLKQPVAAVVPMTLLKQASGGYFDLPNGVRQGITQVIAADSMSGLALLELPSGMINGPELSNEDHGLYLGRDVRVWNQQGPLTDAVTGAVSGAESELLDVAVARRTTPMVLNGDSLLGGVISAADSDQVIGLVVSVDSGGREVQAVDVGAVKRLLVSVNSTQALSVSAFSRKYFEETPEGRWERASQWVDERAYDQALPLLEQLYEEGWQGKQTLRPYLLELYVTMVNEAFARRHVDTVKQLFGRAQNHLGVDPVLTELRLTIALQDLNPSAAYEEVKLLRLQVTEGIDNEAVRRIVSLLARDYVEAGRLISAIELLDEEMARDLQFAPYFALRGRILMQQSEYSAAALALRRAIELDRSFEGDLTALLEEASSWGNTPQRSEVEFEKLQGVILTEVEINGLSERFRMVVDTGASLTVLTPGAMKRLALGGVTQGVTTLSTAGGRIQASLIELDSVKVGGAERKGVTAAVTPLEQGIDGLLGLSFLNGFEVRVKPGQNKLILIRQ